MFVEFRDELNFENQTTTTYEVDIDENLPIKELISVLHTLTNTKEYTIIKWNGMDIYIYHVDIIVKFLMKLLILNI